MVSHENKIPHVLESRKEQASQILWRCPFKTKYWANGHRGT